MMKTCLKIKNKFIFPHVCHSQRLKISFFVYFFQHSLRRHRQLHPSLRKADSLRVGLNSQRTLRKIRSNRPGQFRGNSHPVRKKYFHHFMPFKPGESPRVC